jgi:hypothetical protein
MEPRSLYRVGSLKTVGSELAGYKLHLALVQEVRSGEGNYKPADNYTFFCAGNAKNHLGSGFFMHKGIMSAVQMRISTKSSLVCQCYSECACIN